MEPTLNDHLASLTAAVEDYRRSVKKAQEHFSFEVEQLWRDQAELRDELHSNVSTLSNRIEAVVRGMTTDPAEVAAAIVNDANRSTLREVRDDG